MTLPPVARPAVMLTTLGPLVLRSPPQSTAVAGRRLRRSRRRRRRPGAAPAGRGGRWAIQTGVFSSVQRAAVAVEQLTAIGYPAFQREQTFVTRGTFKVAFAGPYASRPQAETALAALRRVPGFADAMVRELTTP